MAKFVTNSSGRTGYPRFWFADDKETIGPDTISIYCRTRVELDEDEEDLLYKWRIRVFNSEGIRTYSGTVENDNTNTHVNDISVNEGEKNIITVEVRISYTNADGDTEYLRGGSSTYDRVRVDDDYNELLEIGEKDGEDALIAYTRNDVDYTDFWKNGKVNISSEENLYISDHITESNVNKWLNQLRIWKSWYEQDDYYNSYTSTYYTVNKDDDITAAWYNRCVGACGLGEDYEVDGLSNVSDPADATYITAQHFIDLAEAVTDWWT